MDTLDRKLDKLAAIVAEMVQENKLRDQKWRQELNEREAHRAIELKKELDARDAQWAKESAERDARFEKEHKKLSKQLGDWGNSLGRFTEGLAYASIERILIEQFGVDKIRTNHTYEMDGDSIEIDVLGIRYGEHPRVIIVEVKSHLRDDGIEQMHNILKKFPSFFPEFKNYQTMGLIVCVASNKSLKQKTIRQGINLAIVKNNKLFELLKVS